MPTPPEGSHYDYAVYKSPQFQARDNTKEAIERLLEGMSRQGWHLVQYSDAWLIFSRPSWMFGVRNPPAPRPTQDQIEAMAGL